MATGSSALFCFICVQLERGAWDRQPAQRDVLTGPCFSPTPASHAQFFWVPDTFRGTSFGCCFCHRRRRPRHACSCCFSDCEEAVKTTGPERVTII